MRVKPFDLLAALLVVVHVTSAPSAGALVTLKPITESDLRLYSVVLELDEDQRVLAKSFLQDYETRIGVEYLQRYSEWRSMVSAFMTAATQPNASVQARELYDAAFERRGHLVLSLEEHDDRFFNDLELILNDTQRSRFQTVRFMRMRQVYRRGRNALPEANVDLFAFLDQARFRTIQVAHAILCKEQEFILLLRQSDDGNALGERYSIEYSAAYVRMQEHQEGTPERAHWWNECMRAAQHITRYKLPPSDNLVHFNRTFLAELKELLAPREYAAIETKYLREAYPEVYPDPGTAEALYAAALKLDDVDDNTRAAIKGLRDSFRFDHDRLSRRMCESILKRRRASLKNEPIISLWDELLAIGRQREQMNQDQLALLRVLLTPEQVKQLPGWDFVAQPPPRPWDPKWRPDPNAITIQLPQPGEPPVVKVIRPGDDAMHTPRPGEPEADED